MTIVCRRPCPPLSSQQHTRSLFGSRLEFDLNRGFPLFTTKKVFFRGVAEELFWFLRGSTDARELSEKGVRIWDQNSSRAFLDSVGLLDIPTGFIGPGYGHQWRSFGGDYPGGAGGVDQLKYVLGELRLTPQGRRAVLSAWNPQQLPRMALPPCHVLYQFYVGRDGLSCQLVCRSQDLMLGTPFNVASAALLTHVLAHALGLGVDRLVLVGGDVHLYEDHLEGAREQVQREPYEPPKLRITREPPGPDATVDQLVAWVQGIGFEDLELLGYRHWPAIHLRMSA